MPPQLTTLDCCDDDWKATRQTIALGILELPSFLPWFLVSNNRQIYCKRSRLVNVFYTLNCWSVALGAINATLVFSSYVKLVGAPLSSKLFVGFQLIIRHCFQSVKMQPGIIGTDLPIESLQISVFHQGRNTPYHLSHTAATRTILLVQSTCIVYPGSSLKNYLENVSIFWRQPSQWQLHRNPLGWCQWCFRWPTLILHAVVVTSHILFLFGASSLVSTHHKALK